MAEAIISVVIPAYNCSGFIANTLDCLKQQEFRGFEVVIVDDGSKDGSAEVIREYAAAAPGLNIRLILQENKGIAGARNTGAREAKGEFTAFLDHDDFWYPEKLKKCLEVFNRHPDCGLVCHNEVMRDKVSGAARLLTYGPYVRDMFRSLLFKGNCLSTSAVVVRKKVLLESGMFNESAGLSTVEDYDLWLKLSLRCKFYFLPDVLGEYIVTSGNASLDLKKHYNNQITVLTMNFANYRERKPLDFLRINARLATLSLMLVKNGMRRRRIDEILFYSWRAFLRLFSFRYQYMLSGKS